MTDYPDLFTYISNPEFRACIENDWQELNKAIQNGCWKSAHVLAGSIIEAVLADCLYSDAECEAMKTVVLKQTFHDMISDSQQRKIISDGTKQMCVILKDYRNLIHPGKTIRTGATVDEVTASTSRNLVVMVAKDVAKNRKETYGYTADQILSKLYSDPVGFKGVRESLISKLHDQEKERLLVQTIPDEHKKYRNLYCDEFNSSVDDARYLQRLGLLRSTFAYVWDKSPNDIQQRVARMAYRLIHEGSEEDRTHQECGLLLPGYIHFYSRAEQAAVRSNLLNSLQNQGTPELLETTKFLGKWFEDESCYEELLTTCMLICRRRNEQGKVWIEGIVNSMDYTAWKPLLALAKKHKQLYDEFGDETPNGLLHYDWLLNARDLLF